MLDTDKDIIEAFTPERVKQEFYEYEEAKRDRFVSDWVTIPMGADGVTYRAFRKQLDQHSRGIARRVRLGTYIFHPFREIEVEKDPPRNGVPAGVRIISIAAIRDVLVQKVIYKTLHDHVDQIFASIPTCSFAYRRGKSAPQAAKAVHQALRKGYIHVLDADIQSFFDTIPHDRLESVLRDWFGANTITFRLLRRFIHAKRVPSRTYSVKKLKEKKPKAEARSKGIPQGGVLSGLIANIYLHEFDRWVLYDLQKVAPLKYVRYADDFVILLRDPQKLDYVRELVRDKLSSMGLTLHPDPNKTRYVDARVTPVSFVGFHISPTAVRISPKNISKYKKRFLKKLSSCGKLPLPVYTSPLSHLEWIVERKLKYKILGYAESGQRCGNCGKPVYEAHRSWIAFFAGGITDISQVQELDKWIRQTIGRYFYARFGIRLRPADFRKAMLPRLELEYYHCLKMRRRVCQCQLV